MDFKKSFLFILLSMSALSFVQIAAAGSHGGSNWRGGRGDCLGRILAARSSGLAAGQVYQVKDQGALENCFQLITRIDVRGNVYYLQLQGMKALGVDRNPIGYYGISPEVLDDSLDGIRGPYAFVRKPVSSFLGELRRAGKIVKVENEEEIATCKRIAALIDRHLEFRDSYCNRSLDSFKLMRDANGKIPNAAVVFCDRHLRDAPFHMTNDRDDNAELSGAVLALRRARAFIAFIFACNNFPRPLEDIDEDDDDMLPKQGVLPHEMLREVFFQYLDPTAFPAVKRVGAAASGEDMPAGTLRGPAAKQEVDDGFPGGDASAVAAAVGAGVSASVAGQKKLAPQSWSQQFSGEKLANTPQAQINLGSRGLISFK